MTVLQAELIAGVCTRSSFDASRDACNLGNWRVAAKPATLRRLSSLHLSACKKKDRRLENFPPVQPVISGHRP